MAGHDKMESQGTPVMEAVEQSGKARFRAVVLTSLTTIAGLFPFLLERSFQAQFLIPMAVSITFGLMVATVLTLLFVPTFYLIVTEGTAFLGPFFGLKPKESLSSVTGHPT
jgi:HAE1 family hydrophobic/amphiphilic exporter-1